MTSRAARRGEQPNRFRDPPHRNRAIQAFARDVPGKRGPIPVSLGDGHPLASPRAIERVWTPVGGAHRMQEQDLRLELLDELELGPQPRCEWPWVAHEAPEDEGQHLALGDRPIARSDVAECLQLGLARHQCPDAPLEASTSCQPAKQGHRQLRLGLADQWIVSAVALIIAEGKTRGRWR
jgi:hypothetical protein